MTREERIIATFVELTSTMVDDFDVLEFLAVVVERAVELLDCTEAGLLLADPSGRLRVMASSSERAEALEVLQSQNDEGPCYECFHQGVVVFSEDLEADNARWPAFARVAVEKGFRSVQAVPMRVRGETVGALNLFRAAPGRLADADIPLSQGMADIAAAALLTERTLRQSQDVVQQLQGALTSRVVIEQAKGVLAEQAHVTVDAAFAMLRTYARDRGLRLSDVARDLISGGIDAATIAAPVR